LFSAVVGLADGFILAPIEAISETVEPLPAELA
jgi:hypothetical protein